MTTLAVHELTKTFGSGRTAVEAVRGASFEADAGEFIAVVGPSGSGKTTLLAMIGALLQPTSGTILVEGENVHELSGKAQAAFRRTRVGFVFQANNVLPYLTARENLLVMAQIGGLPRGEAGSRADRLIEELGIGDRAGALATELSGGERQRVAIGRALMNDPALILVDEPTAALDTERGARVVESLLAEVKERRKLGIMVTHDLAMAEKADRVLEMRDGHLAEREASTTGGGALP